MTEKETLPNQKINLRRLAEEKAARMAETPEAQSPEETRWILHELRVHQIELEMQNEELRDAQVKLDTARARYFNFYDMAPVGYCTLSEKGLILEANLTAATLLGVARGKLVQQPITRFIHEEDDTIYYLLFKQIFEAHSELGPGMDQTGSGRTDAPRAYELRMVKHDGTPFWVTLSAVAADDACGAPVISIMISDISECKRVEASLRESDEALRTLLSQKEVLLKEVHHRVKNNLQVISSLISLQADKLTGEQLQGGLRDVRDRVQAIALVHEILHQSDDMSLLDFAGYAVSLLQYLWRVHGPASANVRLYMSIAPLMMPVEAATSCGLILTELISNVFKHAFPGGGAGEVVVTLAHDPATAAVCMRVHDNGVGLPADMNWRQPHTLGLHLVQMLAGQIHGAVQAGPGSDLCSEPGFDPNSNPGPGTEFQVNFKL